MILTIDVGNSNIAFGIHDRDRWVDHWRLRTEAEKTADEYLVLFRNLIGSAGHVLSNVERTVLSSVVPALTPVIASVTRKLTGQEPLIVRHTINTGLDPRRPVPAELGSDLLANAVAAYHRYKRAAVVVDFGTALTFTAVSASGAVLGVAIAPGIRSAVGALSSNTAQLPTVELEAPASALGRTTVHSIQAGIVFGYVGLVDAIVSRMKAEMQADPTQQEPVVIATGGLSDVVAPHSVTITAVEPWHTLDGLRILAELNPA